MQTGRWSDPGPEVMFRVIGREDKEFGLGWTHEEIVTPLAKKFISSYKDLPLALFQIQDKFRNEPRAKSGILRGREFNMKDLYSFHANQDDLNTFYDQAQKAYAKIFDRCGLHALVTESSGGAFSKYSHEFQVLTENGEDIIFYCSKCEYAQNREISEYKTGDQCPKCNGVMAEGKAIEVGNIFKLKTRFTDAFDVKFTDENGKQQPVLMGCYGIGPSRVMGAIVETCNDGAGIIWPAAVAPYDAHIIPLGEEEIVTELLDEVVEELEDAGVSVLVDDRAATVGAKFADADLIGLPTRIVVSSKSLSKGGVEVKRRREQTAEIISKKDVLTWLQK